MNRIDRLTAILVMLQTKKIVKANEIAGRFNISLRTVYRDMRALEQGGVPIGAEAGVGYYLTEGYHLPPIMFTPEEAGTLLVADKLLDCFSDESIKRNFKLAADKVKSVLPESHQDFIGQVDRHIHVFHKPPIQSKEYANNFTTRIQQAISARKCVKLQYYSKSKEENSCRLVEPIGLCFYGLCWHLIAYCNLRNNYRDFRLDRIKNLEIEKELISSKAQISISDYFSHYFGMETLFNVVICFNKAVESEISNTRYYYGFYEEIPEGSSIRMKFAVNDYAYIGNWLLSLGEMVEGVENKELNEYLVDKVIRLKSQYLFEKND